MPAPAVRRVSAQVVAVVRVPGQMVAERLIVGIARRHHQTVIVCVEIVFEVYRIDVIRRVVTETEGLRGHMLHLGIETRR